MAHSDASVPYFAATEPRALSFQERTVAERLLVGQPAEYTSQLAGLRVVGRCGCQACPTIFFIMPIAAAREHDLASLVGKDAANGLVGAVLMQREGRLSQLEFYSVDGHDPWSIPNADTLSPAGRA